MNARADLLELVKLVFRSSSSAMRIDRMSKSEFLMLSLEENSENMWCEMADLPSYAASAFNSILPRKMAAAANAEDVLIFNVVQNIILLCNEVGRFAVVDEEEFFYYFAETIELSKLDWLSGFIRTEILTIINSGASAKSSDESWAVHAFVQNLLERQSKSNNLTAR